MTIADQPTLLLIHGAWHNKNCWIPLQQELKNLGIPTVAIDLPAHGTEPSEKSLRRYSITDYRQRVENWLAENDKQPIVPVGHSMGGMIVLDLLKHNPEIDQAILLAPANRAGVWKFLLRLIVRHPLILLKSILTLRLWPVVADTDYAFELFYSDQTKMADVADKLATLQDESFRVFLDFLLKQPIPQDRDILLLSGTKDQIFAPVNQKALASKLKADYVELAFGHNFFVEDPKQTANEMKNWLD